jgi:hypothetical protein
LSCGGIAWLFQDFGPARYRVAIPAMAIYAAIGLVIFPRIDPSGRLKL